MRRTLLIPLVLALTAALVVAQYEMWDGDFKTAREAPSHSTGTPEWSYDPEFSKDVFTFCRINYTRAPDARNRGTWITDFPDSDLNLSYRLQQLTALKVDPDGRVVRLTDRELDQYPWIYMVEPGGVMLSDEEVTALRRYLLKGGFLMVDDFWGDYEWAHFAEQMKQVFPDREFIELPLDHPIYHAVFPIESKGQVPNAYTGMRSQFTGITWERRDAKDVHHRALLDDQGRIMVMATHNSDNGDGWEREGENEYFFRQFSEKISYPLGINIIFYAMTH